MSSHPISADVTCPTCDGTTYAVIPRGCTPVGTGEPDGDEYCGKVWTTCYECDERFVVFYKSKE